MAVVASQAVGGAFCTKSATGALTAASVTAGVLYVNGVVAPAVTVTIDAADAPFYKWTATLPATLTDGDTVQVFVTATISEISTAAIVWAASVVQSSAIGEAVLTADLSDNAALGNLAEGVTLAVTTPPSASAIASEVDSLLTGNHGEGSWAGGGSTGTGSQPVTWPPEGEPITIDNEPAGNVQVQIFTDPDGLTGRQGIQYTQSDGYVPAVWMLDPGTAEDPNLYYAWLSKDGVDFSAINPIEISVVAE